VVREFFLERKLACNSRVEAAMASNASAAIRPLPRETPTILLVEANALKRMAIAGYLRQCGYEVVETDGPTEVRRLLDSGAKADIAFIDLDAKGENDGFALAHWIRKRRRDVKILLTSGVQRAARTAGDLCEHGPHLAKPYEHRDLAAQIRRLLAR
jgi:CheY-like chemotaxis protein